jgi:hypothetical protein
MIHDVGLLCVPVHQENVGIIMFIKEIGLPQTWGPLFCSMCLAPQGFDIVLFIQDLGQAMGTTIVHCLFRAPRRREHDLHQGVPPSPTI